MASCAWAGTVAFGRVAYGAHFPTDVAFSIGLGIALAPLSLRIGDDVVRRLVAWRQRSSTARLGGPGSGGAG